MMNESSEPQVYRNIPMPAAKDYRISDDLESAFEFRKPSNFEQLSENIHFESSLQRNRDKENECGLKTPVRVKNDSKNSSFSSGVHPCYHIRYHSETERSQSDEPFKAVIHLDNIGFEVTHQKHSERYSRRNEN